jgi:hypothetical protein
MRTDGRTLQIDTKITLTMRQVMCKAVEDKFKILAFISVLQEIVTLKLFVIERQYLSLTSLEEHEVTRLYVLATLPYTYVSLRVMYSTIGHHYTTRVSLDWGYACCGYCFLK